MFNRSHLKSQRGSSLIEALIALIMIALIGKGAIYLTNRATAASTDQLLLSMAVTQMRAALTNPAICTTPPGTPPAAVTLPNNPLLPITVQGCNVIIDATIDIASTGEVTIGNIPAPIRLSIDDPIVGGLVVVGGT